MANNGGSVGLQDFIFVRVTGLSAWALWLEQVVVIGLSLLGLPHRRPW